MIYSNDNQFLFWQFKANLLDNAEPREVFTNSKQDVNDMVNRFATMSNLTWSDITPTEDQKQRLAAANEIDQPNKAQWHSEVELFVRTGAIPEGTNTTWLVDMQADYAEQTQAYNTDRTKQEIADFDKQLVAYYDSVAKAKNYDNRVTCALRAGYPSAFQAEGVAFGTWMDTCNQIGYAIIADVIQGKRPKPESLEEILLDFPEMQWPV